MENSGIYFKIDAYSAMFENVSLNNILEYYGIDFTAEELYSNAYKSNLMFEYKFIFQYEGIRLEVPFTVINGLIASSDSIESIFDYPFPSVRLDMSGSGLEFLRSVFGSHGRCLDEFLRVDCTDHFQSLGGSMHITRCDFAFDLVDVAGDFYDKISEYCVSSFDYRQSERICLKGREGGVVATVRRGSERTVYLGTPSSSRLLRIYDKKFQLCRDTVWRKDCPYGNDINSWIRLELQLRRSLAQGILFGHGDANSIFRYIYENYRPVDFETGYKKLTCEFWDNLLDWENTRVIIQNANSTQFDSYPVRVKKGLDRSATKIAVFIARYGLNSFLDLVKNRIFDILSTCNDPVRYKSYKYFIDQLKLMSEGAPIDSLPYVDWVDNVPVICDLFDYDSYINYCRNYEC